MSERCPETVWPDGTGRCCLPEGHGGRHHFDANLADTAPTPMTDTRQAVDAAREWVYEYARSYRVADPAYFDGAMRRFEQAVEAWARADERARLRAEICAASQDAAAQMPEPPR